MKKLIIVMSVIIIATLNACAQTKHEHKSKGETKVAPVFDKTNADVKMQINNLLVVYYKMKDALVADKDADAMAGAKELRKALEKVDMNKMTSAEHTYYMDLQTKLDYDAEHISGAPNIEHIREHFETLSDNMFALVKAFKANNGNAVYFDYCPMAKASWITNAAEIKNPYFGKKMIDCGSVKDSIK